jgi:hypothetical protein
MYSDFVGFLRGGASGDDQPGLECGDGVDADPAASVYMAASVLSDQLSTGAGVTRMGHRLATLRA